MFIKFAIDAEMQLLNLDYIEYIEVCQDDNGTGRITCYTKTPECTDDNYDNQDYIIFDKLCGLNITEAANALFEAMQRGDKAFDITSFYDDPEEDE